MNELGGHYHSQQELASSQIGLGHTAMHACKEKKARPTLTKKALIVFLHRYHQPAAAGDYDGEELRPRHLTEQVLTNIEGVLLVKDDTIIATYHRDHP